MRGSFVKSFSYLPFKWLNIFLSPDQTIKKEIKQAGFLLGLKHFSIATFSFILIFLLFLILWKAPFEIAAGRTASLIKSLLNNLPGILILAVVHFIAFLVIHLITNSIMFLISKIFSKKSDFSSQFYLISLAFAGLFTIYSIAAVMIPCFVILAVLLELKASSLILFSLGYLLLLIMAYIYSVFLMIKSIKNIYCISTLKSAIIVLIGLIPLEIVFFGYLTLIFDIQELGYI